MVEQSTWGAMLLWTVWYKTKFVSQNFGYQIWCLFHNTCTCNVFKNMFNISKARPQALSDRLGQVKMPKNWSSDRSHFYLNCPTGQVQISYSYALFASKDRYDIVGDRWTCIATCLTGQVIPKVKGRYGTYNGNFFHIHSRVVIFGYVMYLWKTSNFSMGHFF